MSILKKIRAPFHEDWCKKCFSEMSVIQKQLYMLPMTVGNYVSHKNPSYYTENLIRVDKKKDIPAGYYACGIKRFCCQECGYQCVHLSVFLPVRDQEKPEETLLFENGELDTFLMNTE